MKVAITADLHLKTKVENTERYNALKNILDQLLVENINNLIIAGDLFDINSQNYSIFDELCKQQKYSQIEFFIIPGNHDSGINSKYFAAKNIKIFNEPTIITLGEPTIKFFFIPYILNKSMGEIIAGFKDTLIGPWLLIGHGDYLSSMKELNTYETGIYMPLSRTDIEYYEPAKVILGHIHKKTNFGKVHYPGSPCGMDINEIGKRSFLIMDLNSLEISEKTVETDYIFFNEILISLPTSNEFDYIKNKITDLINKWNLSKDEIPKARIRLKVKGYTSDKKKLESVIKEKLNSFTYYNNEQPDLIETSVFSDPERIDIVEIVKKEIDALEENLGYIQSEKDDIIEQALHIILRE